MKKRLSVLCLAFVLLLGLAPAALAAEDGGPVPQTMGFGISHGGVIDADGSLWAWGNNTFAMVGNGLLWDAAASQIATVPVVPTPVKIMDHAAAASAGYFTTCAVRTDGTFWIWGLSNDGQLGNGGGGDMSRDDYVIQSVPFQLSSLSAKLPAGEPVPIPEPEPEPAPGPASRPADTGMVSPSSSAAALDGRNVTLNTYLFTDAQGGGTNYVMLRDVAALLSGTAAQFEVGWGPEGITLTTGAPNTPTGAELQGKGDGDRAYTANSSPVTIEGKVVELTAYTIEGNNYFTLRDLGQALGFNVYWDGAVIIDTASPFTGVKPQ